MPETFALLVDSEGNIFGGSQFPARLEGSKYIVTLSEAMQEAVRTAAATELVDYQVEVMALDQNLMDILEPIEEEPNLEDLKQMIAEHVLATGNFTFKFEAPY